MYFHAYLNIKINIILCLFSTLIYIYIFFKIFSDSVCKDIVVKVWTNPSPSTKCLSLFSKTGVQIHPNPNYASWFASRKAVELNTRMSQLEHYLVILCNRFPKGSVYFFESLGIKLFFILKVKRFGGVL
jgi:hypothetical protein